MAMHPKFPIKNRGRQPRKQSVKNENTKKNKKNEKEPMKAPFQISFNGLRLVGKIINKFKTKVQPISLDASQ